MDVGPLVVTDAESAELIQPRKRPLDDPPLVSLVSRFGVLMRIARDDERGAALDCRSEVLVVIGS